MPRPNFSDPYSEVEIQPASVGGVETNKYGVMVTADDGTKHLAGIHAEGYNLITNSLAKDVADDIMSRSPYSWESPKTIWDGKRYVRYYRTIETIAVISNGSTSPLKLGMLGRNSYDGSSKFGMEMYALNGDCLNCYHSRSIFGYFAIRHTDNQMFDIEDALLNIERGAQNLIGVAPMITELRHQDLTRSKILDAVDKIQFPVSRWENVLQRLGEEEGTMFGLLQALTFVATHQIAGISSITTGSSVTEYFVNGK